MRQAMSKLQKLDLIRFHDADSNVCFSANSLGVTLSDLLCAKVWVVAKMRGWLSSRYSRPQEKIFNS